MIKNKRDRNKMDNASLLAVVHFLFSVCESNSPKKMHSIFVGEPLCLNGCLVKMTIVW